MSKWVPAKDLLDWNDSKTLQKIREYSKIVESEKESRTANISKLKVIDYQPVRSKELFLVPPGTVTMFFADNDQAFLKNVTDAFGADDETLLSTLMNSIETDYAKRKRKNLDETKNQIKDNVIIDLKYGSKVLLESISLPSDIKYMIVHLPYNGGKLDYDKFSLLKWHHDTKGNMNAQTTGILVIRAPQLSEAEIEASNKIPPDEYSINLDSPEVAEILPATLLTALLFVAVMNTPFVGSCFRLTEKGTVQCTSFMDDMDKIKKAEEMIRNLGPFASYRHLTAIRKKLLGSET